MIQVLLDRAPLGAAVVGTDGTVRAWSEGAARITGWSAEQVVGRPDPSVPEDDERERMQRLAQVLRDPSSLRRSVLRRLRPDGTPIDLVLESAEVVALEDGPGLVLWFGEATAADVEIAHRNRLSRRLVGASRAEEVVSVLVDALRDLLRADAGIALRRCPEGAHLHGLWALGMEQEDAEAVELDVGSGSWDAALDGMVVDDTLAVGGERRHVRYVPMGVPGEGWVLAVLSDRSLDVTTSAHDVAMAVADEAWGALQRAELIHELDGKVEILEATNALAANVGLDLDDALVAVTHQAASALSCERAAVYLLDEDDGELRLAHVHASDAVPGALQTHGDGLDLARQVVETGRRVLHQDVTDCELEAGPWHADAGTVAVMGLPLRVADSTIGALVVAHTLAHPRGFTSLCTQVGDAVARQAAVAVQHARLYQVERRTVRRLKELDRLKADWMAGLTHDLKAPLTGLLGFVETLRRLTGHVSPEQQQEFLAVMSRQADQLVALVEDLLLSARIDADAVARRRELVEVPALVEGAVQGLSPSQLADLDLEVEPVTTDVLVDRSHMQRVIQNLLSNAWRHGGEKVRLTTTHEGGSVVITVDDDGPGVPVGMREQIFDRFSHGDQAGSTGLGLYVAHGIAVAHEGSLHVTDSPMGGARFVLRLPRGRPQREADLEQRRPTVERRRSDQEAEVDLIV